MNKEVKSFVLYRSYPECLREADEKTRDRVMTAIYEFVFKGIEPELHGVARAVFDLIRPQLGRNIKENKKGGDLNATK